MTKSELIAFRATPQHRQKLELLAEGERTSVSDVLLRLIDMAPVTPVEVVRQGLKLNSGIERQLVGAA